MLNLASLNDLITIAVKKDDKIREFFFYFFTPRNIRVSAKDEFPFPYDGNSVVLSIAATVKLTGAPAMQCSTPAQQPVRIVPNRILQKITQMTKIAITAVQNRRVHKF